MSALKAKLRYSGLSRDGRTNRWYATCPHCQEEFTPPTTRMSRDLLDCPKSKCGKPMVADYNEAIDALNAAGAAP